MTTTPTSGAADLSNALRLANELEESIEGFPEATELENAAAAELRRLHALTAQAISAEPAGAGYAELPEFEELDDDLIDLACSTGALYRVDFRRAWEVVRDGLRASHGQAPAQPIDIKAAAQKIAVEVAKNCGSVPQLTFPHIYLGLKDLLATPTRQAAQQAPATQQAGEREPVFYIRTKNSTNQNWRPVSERDYRDAQKMPKIFDCENPSPQAAQQASAHVLHLVQEAFAEVAMAYPKAFALHKVGLADTAVREALAAPTTPQAADTGAAQGAAVLPDCDRCKGSGEDPEGFYDQSRGPDGATHDGPCRSCGGNGAAQGAGITEVGGVDESQDDSLLLCASDLQHSAIYDNHVEMQSCIRAVADRITALAAPQPAPQPAPPADSQKAPVRQIEDCPELNMSNYDDVDVDSLNDWATRASDEIDRLSAARAQADSVLEDAARYRWLFGARTEVQAASVPETVFKPLPQDEVLSHLQGFYMSKPEVDARWLAERDNVLHSFWILLGEAESQADNNDDRLLKHQVEGFYRQLNALRGSSIVPRWVERAARAAQKEGE